MADHDPLCPITTHRGAITCLCASPDGGPGLIARVRADERATAQVQACDAHISQVRWAEAVTDRLVEVICQQERTRQIHVETIHAVSDDADILRAERDAARAEVAALREQADRYDSVIATLMVRLHDEVLADLRAKVEALRDQYQQYLDSDPTEQERGRAWSRVDSLNGVLALIDKEADRG